MRRATSTLAVTDTCVCVCVCNINNKLQHRVTPVCVTLLRYMNSNGYLHGLVRHVEALAVIVFDPVARVLQLWSGAPLRFFDPFLTLMVHSSAFRHVLSLSDAFSPRAIAKSNALKVYGEWLVSHWRPFVDVCAVLLLPTVLCAIQESSYVYFRETGG